MPVWAVAAIALGTLAAVGAVVAYVVHEPASERDLPSPIADDASRADSTDRADPGTVSPKSKSDAVTRTAPGLGESAPATATSTAALAPAPAQPVTAPKAAPTDPARTKPGKGHKPAKRFDPGY
jgi:hypothetical protein